MKAHNFQASFPPLLPSPIGQAEGVSGGSVSAAAGSHIEPHPAPARQSSCKNPKPVSVPGPLKLFLDRRMAAALFSPEVLQQEQSPFSHLLGMVPSQDANQTFRWGSILCSEITKQMDTYLGKNNVQEQTHFHRRNEGSYQRTSKQMHIKSPCIHKGTPPRHGPQIALMRHKSLKSTEK